MERLKESRTLLALLFLAASYCLYWKTFSFEWTYDDVALVVENRDIRSISNFLKDTVQSRPLREITLFVDYTFFGINPSGYHFQNILWHGLNGFLLYRVALLAGFVRSAAFVSGLVFLFHPVNVEVVALASHRKDSLAFFFVMLSLLSFKRVIYEEGRKRSLWCIALLSAVLLSFAAKQNALLLPILLLCFEYLLVPAHRRVIMRRKESLPVLAGILLLAAFVRVGYLLQSDKFRLVVVAAMDKMSDYTSFSMQSYYLLALKSQTFLFSKWFWPLNLAPEYAYSAPLSWMDPWVLSTMLMLGLLGFLFAWGTAKSPGIAFALSFLLFWLPTSNYFGYFSYFAADRYLYLPSAGLAMLSGLVLTGLKWRKFFWVIPCVAIFTLGALSYRQIDIWKNPATLSEHIQKTNPNSSSGQIAYAGTLAEKGMSAEAIAILEGLLLKKALDPEVLRALAFAYYKDGQLLKAIATSERVYSGAAPGNLFDLAGYYLEAGYLDKAERTCRKIVDTGVQDEKVYMRLGHVYELKEEYDLALQTYRKVIKLFPESSGAHYNAGVVCYTMGKVAEGYEHFKTSFSLSPDDIDAAFNYAYTAIDLGYYAEAKDILPKIKTRTPGRAQVLTDRMKSLKDKLNTLE